MQASNSLAKLSSGTRIVKASDDAASLAVGTKVKADVTALKQAATNAGQASSLLQVADGGMAKVSDILLRMKALAVQAQSGSVTDNERAFLDREYQQLSTQIDDIATQTKFNGAQLLNGAAGKDVAFTGATDTVFNTDSTYANGLTANLSGNADAGTYQLAYAYHSIFKPRRNSHSITAQLPTVSSLLMAVRLSSMKVVSTSIRLGLN